MWWYGSCEDCIHYLTSSLLHPQTWSLPVQQLLQETKTIKITSGVFVSFLFLVRTFYGHRNIFSSPHKAKSILISTLFSSSICKTKQDIKHKIDTNWGVFESIFYMWPNLDNKIWEHFSRIVTRFCDGCCFKEELHLFMPFPFISILETSCTLPAGQTSGRRSVWPWRAGSPGSPGNAERTRTPANGGTNSKRLDVI